MDSPSQGHKKFGAGYDPVSGRFYVLSNPILPAHSGYGFLTPQLIRNTGALLSSTDLKRWDVEQLFLYSPHIDYEAFQYFNFDIDGDDLIIASRTAFDIGSAFKPPRGHDSNLITFHRIQDFRNATACHFLRVEGNTIQRYELTQHGHAPLGSFVLGNHFDGSLLGTVTGIARGPLGRVLVSEQSGRILLFDALGNFIETLSSSETEFQTEALGISQPPYGERAWIMAGSGDWQDLENWYYWGRPDMEYEVANFGSAINSQSTIALNESYILKGIRFRSEHKYTLSGTGAIDIEAENGMGILEAQRGSHRIELPITLHSNVEANLYTSASVQVAGSINLNGEELSAAGGGELVVHGEFAMNGGRMVLDGLSALRFSNPDAVSLNGSLQFKPDTSLTMVEGSEFILMDVSEGLSGEFEKVLLPELANGLVWDTSQLYSQGIVRIVSET